MMSEPEMQRHSLDDPARLRQRIDVLDCLEPYTLDIEELSHVSDRARAISARLETINRALFADIRREIQCGTDPDILRRWVAQLSRDGQLTSEGYDALDVLISGVLQFDLPEGEVAELAAEMVFYQPTPARHIFDLLSRVTLTEHDVLVDLGSGLGHVPLLVSICTHAHSIGIEQEITYVACAQRCANALNLANVTFFQQDARIANLSSGTLFYLYTPFTGTILRDVLESLRREAEYREIRICTYGPCTPIVAKERWLDVVGALHTDRITVFQCRH